AGWPGPGTGSLGHAASAGDSRKPAGSPGETTEGHPRSDRIYGIGFHTDRERDGGVDHQLVPDTGQGSYLAETGHASQLDPARPGGYCGGAAMRSRGQRVMVDFVWFWRSSTGVD